MQNQNRKFILYQLIVQIAISVLYAFGFINILVKNIMDGGFFSAIDEFIKHFPFLVILILSILPEISLLIKHKLHSQDGEILPLLFTAIALQGSFILPEAIYALGFYFDYPFHLLILQRFSLLSSASIFLLSSLRYFGFSSSHMWAYNIAFLSLSFLISAIIPISSYQGEVAVFSSIYDAYLILALILIYASAILTFIVFAFKDRTALNIKRSISFICLIIGIILSSLNTMISAILSLVFYIIGTIILVTDAGDSL